MNSKKIVFLINSLEGGGAERVVSTLLNSLVEEYVCYLILMENKISYKLDNRINVINLNEKSNQNGIVKLIKIPIIAYRVSKIIKQYELNQVISFLHRANYVNVISGLFSNYKVIISERIASSSMYSDNSMTSKVSKFLIKNLYNKSDLIISVSNAIESDLKNNFNIKNKQVVIYNPYDIENINRLAQEPIDYEINKEKSIITAGSLGKRKNHALLIKSFSMLDDEAYKLYVLGQGEDGQHLKTLVKVLNIESRVVFLGFDSNPYKYLSKCSIFVLSSNSEGFPNVLAEAMVCGCSVISTDCLSGPREILAPNSDVVFPLKDDIELAEYGLLTAIKNEEKLKEAMELMISNKALREKYSKKAKERMACFSIKKIIKQYEAVICYNTPTNQDNKTRVLISNKLN